MRHGHALACWLVAAAGCGGSGDTAGTTTSTTASSTSSSSSSGGGAGGMGGAGGAGVGGGGGTGGAEPAMCQGSGATGYNPYKRAYYGDLHLHTSFSLDSYSFGNRNDPHLAYLFAKGMTKLDIGSGTKGRVGPTGVDQKRVLDFLAVTDHSEWLGIDRGCLRDPKSAFYDSQECKTARSEQPLIQDLAFANLIKAPKSLCGSNYDDPACVAEQKSAWNELQDAAAKAYDPCRFTSLVAYEWTSEVQHAYVDNGQQKTSTVTNHRNVIFANASVPARPFDALHATSNTPPLLWEQLDQGCANNPMTPGCDAIVIPHNSNLSAGESLKDWGSPLQAKYQVAAEIYQHKGASECLYDPAHGLNDADCKFEQINPSPSLDVQPNSFVRTALENGIAAAAKNPSVPNPLMLGIVGATDDHNGAPGNVDEAAFVGHVGRLDDQPDMGGKGDKGRLLAGADNGSGAITGVFAEQNTRTAIYAAIKRRETFATSGPRIEVRLFQTSDPMACDDPSFPKKIVDAKTGKPMGSEVSSKDLGVSGKMYFAVSAWPDDKAQNLADGTTAVTPFSAVQIIKAHVKKGGGAVTEDAPLVLAMPAMGGCVTVPDDGFDATEYAVYYVRALQVPTWRWSHYDCLSVQASDATWQTDYPGCTPGGDLDVSIQERAWTSPIWFTPD